MTFEDLMGGWQMNVNVNGRKMKSFPRLGCSLPLCLVSLFNKKARKVSNSSGTGKWSSRQFAGGLDL